MTLTTPLPQNATVETIAVQRLTIDIASPYAEVIEHFRSLVPAIKLSNLREQTSADGIAQVIRETGTTTDFVLFAEFDHGRWIRYFAPRTVWASTATATTTAATAAQGAPAADNPPVGPPSRPNASTNPTCYRRAHRFIFGNPLIAINMIRESLEATLHVPLDCGFVEQEGGSTRMVVLLPDGLVAGHAGVSNNETLHRATDDLQRKIFALIEAITKKPFVTE
ncbi:hypothetical protein QQS21_006566 [Conoideocrella luteorostrata]|uniref:Uncharacterized protein n=1 Tax=Conoideocrella luteorostrata TaxID=1105319 RepID=A0AAJ0CPS1_9HYPO|nr:hypothetical protein QQS21_006566 [Conoideocrella luteorostrata]